MTSRLKAQSLYLVSLVFGAILAVFQSTFPAAATSTDCGNGSNVVTPGNNLAACGLFNNVGTTGYGSNSAFGIDNQTVNGSYSSAFGYNNTVGITTTTPFAGVTYGLAVGDNNNVQGNVSNAIGHNNAAYGSNMNIFGTENVVGISGNSDNSSNSTVAGNNNTITNTSVVTEGSYVLGNRNYINGGQNVAIGDRNIIGTSGLANNYSFVGGTGSSVYASRSIAMGYQASVGTSIGAVQDSIAIGPASRARGNYATAVGPSAYALGDSSIALGSASTANNALSVAIGESADVSMDNSVALGASSTATGIHTGAYTLNGGTAAGTPNAVNGVVSVGSVGQERQIQNVAAGVISSTSTDAVNGSQLYTVANNVNSLGTTTATALGGGSAYTAGVGVSAPNYVVQNVTYHNVGDAIAAVQGGISPQNIYFSAQGSGVLDGALASGVYSTASGGGSTASGDQSTAIGSGSTASATGSLAVGYNSTASGNNSSAFGQGAVASGENSTAVGAGAIAARANQIALGSGSSTYTTAGITSSASRSAQTGVTQFVTTDANGNLANSSYGPSDIAGLNNSVTGLNTAVGILGQNVSSLSNRVDGNQREARQGIALAMAMPTAHFPSAPGKTTVSGSMGNYKGYGAVGAAFMHRLDTNMPVAVGVSTSIGMRNSVGVKGEVVTEF